MSGVIDEDGQQWEHCNGCTKFIRIEDLLYEQPTMKYRYGRDLCPPCRELSKANPGCDIQPDPGEVALREKVARELEESMRGKEYVFKEVAPNVWDCHIVDVN